MKPIRLLQDRIVFITGATGGIGKAVSLEFAKQGATVILSGRSNKALEAVYDQIVLLYGECAAIYPLDLTQAGDEQYKQLAEVLENEFGQLDGLIHNAALLDNLRPLSQTATATWEQQIQVNLQAPFMMTRELLPLLRLSSYASVLFTGHGLMEHKAFWGAYGISKYALSALMQMFTEEEEGVSTVRFNCIDPVKVKTALRMNVYPGEEPLKIPEPANITNLYLQITAGKYQRATGEMFLADSSSLTEITTTDTI